ncbi:MAG: hypothetical protein WDO73_21435 [Ignavibacteriota bacterium]
MIDADKLNLTYCKITAPITGRVGLRLVDPGNIVHASDTNPMLVITQVQPISAIFTVAEDDLPRVLRKLAAGQHLQVDAYDRGGTTKISTGFIDHGGQSNRSHHRNAAPARHVRQCQQSAFPQPVRQSAAAVGGKR